MSHVTITLETIIERSFDGKQRALATASGITPGQVSKFLKGTQPLTHSTLETLCNHLDKEDCQALCLAAARDLLPPDIAEAITLETPTQTLHEPTTFNDLDPKTEEIFTKLRALVRKDPETRDWLHHLATWIFPNSNQD